MYQLLIIIYIALLGIGSPDKPSVEKAWPDELNTAADAGYLNQLERDVILELNKVRSDPPRYAKEYLEELKNNYKGKLLTYEGQIPIMTVEGVSPLEECIRVLRKTPPRPLLHPAKGLAKAAQELMEEQQRTGSVGHISYKGTTPQKRIEKYGQWDICSSEDIAYGSIDARQIVASLLIDDGVPKRGHRKNILNPCTKFAGVAKGNHPVYRVMCVIDYAGDYQSK